MLSPKTKLLHIPKNISCVTLGKYCFAVLFQQRHVAAVAARSTAAWRQRVVAVRRTTAPVYWLLPLLLLAPLPWQLPTTWPPSQQTTWPPLDVNKGLLQQQQLCRLLLGRVKTKCYRSRKCLHQPRHWRQRRKDTTRQPALNNCFTEERSQSGNVTGHPGHDVTPVT